MPSIHLILCHPLLLLPPVPPSIRVFSNESTLRMRWPNYWSFSFSISHYIYIMLVLHNSWTLKNMALSYTVSLIYVNYFFPNKYVLHACMLSRAWLFETLWTVACQAPTSMGFPRQEYWSELPFPLPGYLVEPGTETASPVSHASAGSLYYWATWEWCHMCTSVHGILHVRILEWVAIPFCMGSSQPKDWTRSSWTARRFLTIWATR